MNRFYFILKLSLLIIVIILVCFGTVLEIRRYFISSKEEKVDLLPYSKILSENVNEFSNIAQKLHSDRVYEFCVQGSNDYKINGIIMDFGSNEFNYSAPLGVKKLTMDEALSLAHLSLENINKYQQFINKYPFIHCIKEDLNLKIGKEYALLLEVNNYKGFVFISDGSLTQNVRQDIINQKYKSLDRIDETNWYEFTFKNQYGL